MSDHPSAQAGTGNSPMAVNLDFPRTAPLAARHPPNPPEDLSEHGAQTAATDDRGAQREPVVYGPDGNGESAELDDDGQVGRGAD
ncbi:MAG TPA: hypothetical protein VH253_05980 [Phycisphaerae bacterium]|nr:hypothetical protein [Phycisphaerae bacterium]